MLVGAAKNGENIFMPNWNSNTLTVTGPKEQLKWFKKGMKKRGTKLSLNQSVPMPPCLKDTTAPQNSPNWYEWCIVHWGTKWDTREAILNASDKELIYDFDTAWGPSDEWLTQTSRLFKELHFFLKYSEPGMAFQGTIEVKGGKILNETNEDYVNEDESDDEN